MPNWVYSEVTLAASYEELQDFLTRDESDPEYPCDIFRFNLHRLFPERFGPEDACGYEAWDYDWMVDHTGSKWNPKVDHVASSGGEILICFKSAWSPSNLLLERLHQKTGWKIHNEFEEEALDFEGSFHCENGICAAQLRPRRPECSFCELNFPREMLDEETGECPKCRRSDLRHL